MPLYLITNKQNDAHWPQSVPTCTVGLKLYEESAVLGRARDGGNKHKYVITDILSYTHSVSEMVMLKTDCNINVHFNV